MRIAFLSAALAATTFTALPAAPAQAQNPDREYRRDVRQADREYRRDVRRAQRDYRQYNRYDYNRFEPGQRSYLADQYYRDGRYYQQRRLGRNDRIYRGQNGRYYCRRNDGTTGLIIGGLAGGVVGNLLDNGRSSLLGTLLGGAGGAVIGRSVDRGQVVCR